ncbi:substrate-binding periplasmic protein [Desulfopila aestuarii]|uniref:Polar amino acid transport system substrate-binding protein n=1 Tax=Desulfopila aestuarii DSM 18488 TaxID=1121416 RepID=A0A1M7YGP3_9BACT|nr:transporter substrate-binding domain-containing protein [Desulfopila aestuarii]SHO51790.1 polar amino acid transport system substrate-binding protein [Desulfopila aestuarii DSM 18488]
MGYQIFFSCFLLVLLIAPLSYAEEEILIATEDWPPYSYVQNGEITGVSADIVKHILTMLNKSYEIFLFPSTRSTYTLNNRPHTMMFTLFRTPQRESQYKWIGPLSNGSIYLYKRKDTYEEIKSLDDIKEANLLICCRKEGLIHDLLTEKGFKNLDDTAALGPQIYKKLLAGRCDFAISETDLGVRYILKSFNLKVEDLLEKVPFPIFEAELYIVASRDIPDEEIQLWQSALESMKSTGVYEEIIQKYR